MHRAIRALEVLRSVNKDMPIGAAVSFLQIAVNEGLSITELSNKQGDLLATTSRYVQALGDTRGDKRPGLELVSAAVDPTEFRKKVLKLSPQGRRISNQIVDAINARLSAD